MGLSISIHKSAAFVIPFLLIKFLPLKYGKFMAIGMISIFFSLFLVKGLLESYLVEILALEDYSHTINRCDKTGMWFERLFVIGKGILIPVLK